jgi:PAS domain S-box-containing protein
MAQRQHAIDLTRTLENVNIPSFVADRRARVVWANKAAKTAFGDVIGKATTTFVAPDDVPFVERQIERKLRGAPGTDYEVEVLTADGRRRPAEVSSVPIREGGFVQGIFGVVVARSAPERASPTRLTQRKTEVLRLLGDGLSTEDIARTLYLSPETIRNHVRRILSAFGAHSRLEAVASAFREGLLE